MVRHRLNRQRTPEASFRHIIARPAAWPELSQPALKRYASRLLLAYATENEPALLPYLLDLYALLVQRCSLTERTELALAVCERLPSSPVAVRVMVPMIAEEPEPSLVATLSLNLAMLMPPQDHDALTGPRYLVELAQAGVRSDQARVGVLQALLVLGDRRLKALTDRCWTLLGRDAQQRLSDLRFDVISAHLVESCLGWLEAVNEQTHAKLYGAIAAQLVRLPLDSLAGRFGGYVVDVERAFPAPLLNLDAPGGVKITQRWTIAEYAERIGPRLLELSRRERGDKILPLVLRIWGIVPLDRRPMVEREAGLRRAITDRAAATLHRKPPRR